MMTRWLCLLGVLPALALAQGKECVWKELRQAPKFVADDGNAVLTLQSDPNWWRCAEKAGGELFVEFNVGQGGVMTPEPAEQIDVWDGRKVMLKRKLCARGSGTWQVQATLTGKGPMERLAFTSTVLETFCPKCEWSGADNMFVLHTGGLTAPGMFTLDATLDPGWHKCAKPGSTLSLYLFTSDDHDKVRDMKEPTHVVKGLEGSPRVKKAFPKGPVCQGKPKYLGYEFHGTGEMQVINTQGRGITEVGRDCN
jgi:hypothetical protein